MQVLVGVIVYNRLHTINQWLRAWQNAQHFGARLLVVHNYDGAEPKQLERNNIEKWKPDYYWPRPNVGQDIAALRDVIASTSYEPWDVLCWFVDDNLPMRRDFLRPFIAPFEKSQNIGLVGNYYVENGFWVGNNVPTHFRTTAFSLRRNAAKRLRFPDPLLTKQDCWLFEWAGDAMNMTNQVRSMGYGIVPACKSFRRAWTDCNEYVWDTEGLGPRTGDIRCRKDLWRVYEQQFHTEAILGAEQLPAIQGMR